MKGKGTVFVVVKLEHELVNGLGVLDEAKVGFLDCFREAKVGEGGGNNMERWV